jgi:hypothetical protein
MRARKELSWRGWVWLSLFFLLASPAFAAEPSAPALSLWGFDQGIFNEWAGRYNVYQREPSWARTYLDAATARPGRGHSLRVTVHQDPKAFCGLWMDLAGEAGASKNFQDASAYRYLSFWIKGERGGEDFELTLADAARAENSESLTPLRLTSYLPGGVTRNWQEVLIPLTNYPTLDLSHLARLILHFTAPGDYRFYLGDIALKPAKDSPISSRSIPKKSAPSGVLSSADQALWVWKTPDLFDAQARDRFLAFCAAHHLREIYLSVEFTHPNEDPSRPLEISAAEQVRQLVERLHQQGLKVDALAGTPEWAMKKNHSEALAAAEAVVEFNRASPAAARFEGVHYDVEPYLLMGYDDPPFGRRVREEFLEMVSQVVARVQSEPALSFSCDVPSWFYPADGPDRENVLATFHGQEKTVGEHLTDMLDTVTIMDYINQADGAGGIIARGIPALEYAASQNKKILVGVETFLEPDRTVYFAGHVKKEDFPVRLDAADISGRVFVEGFRLVAVSDGTASHLGLSAPVEMTESERTAFEGVLLGLVRKFNGSNNDQADPAAPGFEAARAALAKDPDWRGFETFEIADPESGRPVRGFRSIRRMSPRITFHGLGRTVFEEETASSNEWLSRFPGYAGLAIHFYDSYQELLGGK